MNVRFVSVPHDKEPGFTIIDCWVTFTSHQALTPWVGGRPRENNPKHQYLMS